MSLIKRYDRLGKPSTTPPIKQKDDWGESVTDKSSYRPQSSVIRAELGALNGGGAGIYGSSKDQGDEVLAKTMAWARRLDLDRTEIEAMAEKVKTGLDKRMEELKVQETLKKAEVEKASQTSEEAPTSEQ